MNAVVSGTFRRSTVLNESLAFAAQVLITIAVQVGDDLARGIVSQHGAIEGIRNARQIVAFEAAHGFWIEPAWQLFFQQTHRVLSIPVSWTDIAHFMNAIYVFGHVFGTLGVGIWVYCYRRRFFALFRNTIIVTNVIAVILYQVFPVAPPRLTSNLTFNHHPFTFQDTMYGVLFNGGRVGSTPVSYNEFSAMPSLHIAWALVVGITVVLLARPLAVKLLGFLYPALMLLAVVVTGNHYLLDAVGATACVATAATIVLALERWWDKSVRSRRRRRASLVAP